MKNFKFCAIFMVLFLFGTNHGFAQINCSDIKLQVGGTSAAYPLDASCQYVPSIENEDCFLMNFPVYFVYVGNDPNPPTNFNVNSLTIKGNVTGSGNIMVDENNTERCESQNLTMDFDASNNTFEVTSGLANLALQPPLGGQIAFWIFLEVRPFESVSLEFTEITVELQGGGTCNLSLPPVITNNQDVAGECELTDLSLELQTFSVPTDIWLNINSNSNFVQVGRLDGMVKVTDTYGNLGVISGVAGLNSFDGIAISSTVSIGNEHFIYFEYDPAGVIQFNPNFPADSQVMQIEINDPDVTNAGGEAIVELLWSRWKMENSNTAECCQPTLDTPKTLTFEGQLPCGNNPDITFSVQPAINPIFNDSGCEGQLEMQVFAHNVADVGFSIVEMEVDFEIEGAIELDEAATLAAFNSGNNIGCPSTNYCGNTCLEVYPSQNRIRYSFCTNPQFNFTVDGNGLPVIFSGSDGCVKSASFRVARVFDGDLNGNTFNCVPGTTNWQGEECIEIADFGYTISGTIKKANGTPIEDADVHITSSDCDVTLQSQCNEGQYSYSCDTDMASITPEKNGNVRCGVTTFDLVLISKHILAVEPFENPYQIVAADANGSGNVSTLDLVAIRKVILFIDDVFPNGGNWRFVDANYEFPPVPFFTVPDFPESIDLDIDCESPNVADFFGIKLGDVNYSCKFCNTNQSVNEFGDPVVLTVEKETQGNKAIFKFKTEGFTDIVGYQMDLEYNKNVMSFDRSMAQDLAGVYEDYFGVNTIGQGKIRTLWYDENGQSQSLANFEKIFNIIFDGTGDLSSATVSLYENSGSRLIKPVYNNVAYDSEGRIHPIIQKFGIVNQEVIDLQAFPNPFSNDFQLKVTTNGGEFARIKVFDTVGRLLLDKKKFLYEGENILAIPESAQWSEGLYYYEVETNQGKYAGKIAKQ